MISLLLFLSCVPKTPTPQKENPLRLQEDFSFVQKRPSQKDPQKNLSTLESWIQSNHSKETEAFWKNFQAPTPQVNWPQVPAFQSEKTEEDLLTKGPWLLRNYDSFLNFLQENELSLLQQKKALKHFMKKTQEDPTSQNLSSLLTSLLHIKENQDQISQLLKLQQERFQEIKREFLLLEEEKKQFKEELTSTLEGGEENLANFSLILEEIQTQKLEESWEKYEQTFKDTQESVQEERKKADQSFFEHIQALQKF